MTVNEILKKYSKEVIIEWVTNRYPVFMNKNIKEELEDVKSELNYEKMFLYSKRKLKRGKKKIKMDERVIKTNNNKEVEKL